VRLETVGPDQDAGVIDADHVIAGTGYEFDVDRISFLDPALLHDLRRHDLSPKLDRHFQSSVPGLYFMGPVAAESFGPLVRFVAGAPFAVSRVSSHLSRRGARRASAERRTALITRAAIAGSGFGA
jgi:hypothetical protein